METIGLLSGVLLFSVLCLLPEVRAQIVVASTVLLPKYYTISIFTYQLSLFCFFLWLTFCLVTHNIQKNHSACFSGKSQLGYASDDKERLNRGTFHAAHAIFDLYICSQTFSILRPGKLFKSGTWISLIISASDTIHGLSC